MKSASNKKYAESDNLLKPYLKEVLQTRLLDPAEEISLATAIGLGDTKALHLLISHNLRMVLKIARRYVNRGLAFEDLIEEGNLGLIRACEKFDPTLGFRFSTYAFPWITQSIERALLNQAPTIRVPVHLAQQLKRLQRKQNQLSHEQFSKPTLQEAADAINEEIPDTLRFAQQSHFVVSLHNSNEEDNGYNNDLEESLFLIENETELSLQLFQEKEELKKALHTLPSSQQIIILLRYGIDGTKPRTLEEIGDILQLSREGVRQQETKALAALRKVL